MNILGFSLLDRLLHISGCLRIIAYPFFPSDYSLLQCFLWAVRTLGFGWLGEAYAIAIVGVVNAHHNRTAQ